MHVYFSDRWKGEPKESEEMKPKWFSVGHIPYKKMWPADIFWFPKVIDGNIVKARFKLGENDIVIDKKIKIIG